MPDALFYIPYRFLDINFVPTIFAVPVESLGVSGWDVQKPENMLAITVVIYANFEVVPLPAAVWLLGSGLLGVIGFRRRSKK